MNLTLISRAICVAAIILAVAVPLHAADKKTPAKAGATTSGGAGNPKQVKLNVELRLVKKGAGEAIDGNNENSGYDAVVKFEYQKTGLDGKNPETVSAREILEPSKPKTLVTGGTKFHIKSFELKDVELRTKM